MVMILSLAVIFGVFIFYLYFYHTKELSQSLFVAFVASLVVFGIMVWIYSTNPYGIFDKLPKNSEIFNGQTKQLNDLNKN